MKQFLDKVDNGIFAAEKIVVAIFFAVMSLVVFGDVTHRVFSSPQSRFAEFWGRFGVDPQSSLANDVLGPATLALVAMIIVYAAFRERLGQASPRRQSAIYAVVTVAALAVIVKAFVTLLPNGLIWSQTLSLSMMLWIGLVGASMAAKQRRHLALEIGGKLWPEKLQKPIRIVAGLTVAAFCIFLSYLAFTLIEDEYQNYDPVYGTGAFQGLPLPKWIVFLALPYGFIMLFLRYFRGQLEGGEVNELEHLIKGAAHGGEAESGAGE